MRPNASEVSDLEKRLLQKMQESDEAIGTEVIISLLLMLVDLRQRVECLEGGQDGRREDTIVDGREAADSVST
jgi:hypothetical protein